MQSVGVGDRYQKILSKKMRQRQPNRREAMVTGNAVPFNSLDWIKETDGIPSPHTHSVLRSVSCTRDRSKASEETKLRGAKEKGAEGQPPLIGTRKTYRARLPSSLLRARDRERQKTERPWRSAGLVRRPSPEDLRALPSKHDLPSIFRPLCGFRHLRQSHRIPHHTAVVPSRTSPTVHLLLSNATVLPGASRLYSLFSSPLYSSTPYLQASCGFVCRRRHASRRSILLSCLPRR